MTHPDIAARERARWFRCNAHLWVRPDAARFLAPGADLHAAYPALATKYSPNQPRVPAGNPDGGQWTDGSASGRPRVIIDTTDFRSVDADVDDEIDSLNLFGIASSERDENDVRLAQVGSSITDADGLPYYARGGHHEMPKGVYEKWDLPPETRKVFNDSTTGSLPGGKTVNTSEGSIAGHYWDGPRGRHRAYNDAVEELGERFIKDRGIVKETMTPEQARELLAEIRNTDDPAIRNYNRGIRMLRRFYRLIRGRE